MLVQELNELRSIHVSRERHRIFIMGEAAIKLASTQQKIQRVLRKLADSECDDESEYRRPASQPVNEIVSLFSESPDHPITVHCRAVEQLSFDLEMLPVKGKAKQHLWESTLQWLAVLTPDAEPVELIKEEFECESCQKYLKLHCSDCRPAENIRLMHVTSYNLQPSDDLQLERRLVYLSVYTGRFDLLQ